MKRFMYYVPGIDGTLNHDRLHDAGLGYAFPREIEIAPGAAAQGPDGSGGHLAARKMPGGGSVLYKPSEQTWNNEGEFWIGWQNDAMPGEEDLRRDHMVAGEHLRFDDSVWLVPIVRQFELYENELLPFCTLPMRLTRVDGNWVPGEPKKQYAELWRLTEEYARVIAGADGETDEQGDFRFSIDLFPQVDHLAILALTCNYFVSAAEVDILGIYDSQVRQTILDTITDIAGFHALFDDWSKKNGEKNQAPNGGTLSDGHGKLTPDASDQPATAQP